MRPPHWFGTPAPMYAHLVPILAHAARAKGYAIALHGSMNYDLDLVAIPWTNEAVSPEDLVAALREATHPDPESPVRKVTGPVEKPHGRRAWTIPLGAGLYVDVSVMPRTPPRVQGEPPPLGGAQCIGDRVHNAGANDAP